jgi:hypothetical protein
MSYLRILAPALALTLCTQLIQPARAAEAAIVAPLMSKDLPDVTMSTLILMPAQ